MPLYLQSKLSCGQDSANDESQIQNFQYRTGSLSFRHSIPVQQVLSKAVVAGPSGHCRGVGTPIESNFGPDLHMLHKLIGDARQQSLRLEDSYQILSAGHEPFYRLATKSLKVSCLVSFQASQTCEAQILFSMEKTRPVHQLDTPFSAASWSVFNNLHTSI